MGDDDDDEEIYDTMEDDDRNTQPRNIFGAVRGGGRGGYNPGPPRGPGGPVPTQQPQHRPKVQLNRNRGL